MSTALAGTHGRRHRLVPEGKEALYRVLEASVSGRSAGEARVPGVAARVAGVVRCKGRGGMS